MPSRVSFPRGFGPLVERAHALGVKFGLHLMRGIPRAAVDRNLPIHGSDRHAADIADTADTCPWCHYMYGVDTTRPGAQAYYDSVVALLASWGVDFLKVDDVIHRPREIDAIARCGRDIVLSLSPGNAMDPALAPTYRRAAMFRITGDVWDRRADLDRVFERWERVQDLPLEGLWPDLDMIPFGELMVWNPPGASSASTELAGQGTRRRDRFTPAQRRAFITQRALAASPLFMGGELTMTDDEAFRLITHPDMLACNDNGVVGRLALRRDGVDVWVTPSRGRPDAGWLGVFNRTTEPWSGALDLRGVTAFNPAAAVWSIWPATPLAAPDGRLALALEPDDVAFLRVGEP